MTGPFERFAELDALLERVLGLEPASRRAFLEGIRGSDEPLHSALRSLLQGSALGTLPAIESTNRLETLERGDLEELLELVGREPQGVEVGRQLGPYKVRSRLGAGGMGEVYMATDTRLGREVAIKVLPSRIRSSAELRARFEREARLISRLTHPNICTLHDIGEEDGVAFLVMERLVGETLQERLAAQGKLRPREALRVGADTARALAAAHAEGVVHRDLKPGNLFLTETGTKLLDFGLARSARVPLEFTSQSPTEDEALTVEGTILGTLQYMSPEQVEGREVDARSDIFSLGCVLYEMLCGERPFEGETPARLITSILSHEPQRVSRAADDVYRQLDPLVATCLSKRPEERWQSAADLARQLEFTLDFHDGEQDRRPQPEGAAARSDRRSHGWWTTGLVAVASGLAVLLGTLLWPGTAKEAGTPMVFDLEVDLGDGVDDRFPAFAISPDGTRVVARRQAGLLGQLYIRHLDRPGWEPIGPDDVFGEVVFSPDGEWLLTGLGFANQLVKIPVAGGPTVTLRDGRDLMWASWQHPHEILVSGYGQPVVRLSPQGEILEEVTELGDDLAHQDPQLLPGGDALLFRRGFGGRRSIVVKDLASGIENTLLEDARIPRLVRDRILLFERDGTLWAQEFDTRSRSLKGEPVAALTDIAIGGNNGAQFDVSRTGTLVYLPHYEPTYGLSLRARDGRHLETFADMNDTRELRLSSDQRSLAFVRDSGGTRPDVWVRDVESGVSTRVTTTGGGDPMWHPAAGKLTHIQLKDDRWRSYLVDLTTFETEQFYEQETFHYLMGWGSNDFVVIEEPGAGQGRDVTLLDPQRKKVELANTEHDERDPAMSYDGRFVAYCSNLAGTVDVYLAPVAAPLEKKRVTTHGGSQPRFSIPAPGEPLELFFVTPDGFLNATTLLDEKGNHSPPEKLFAVPFATGPYARYEVAPNGGFFVTEGREEDFVPNLRVVLNWVDHLETLVN